MRVALFLQLCASLVCLVWGGEELSAQESLLPRNPLVRGCGDQLADRSLYVSTIDGGLTALDEEGHTLWSYQASTPLFFSSLSPTESEEVSERIVPSLDGGMYHWNGDKLTQLPFTADDLIDHAQLLKRPGGIVAGAKATDIVGVNIHTGKPIYECSHEKCHRYDNQSLIQRMDILKLSTSRVTVREASDLTGEEMWNFTVGSMQLMLVEGEEEGESEGGGQSCGVFRDLQWELHADVLRGVVYATSISSSDHHLWEVELGVPVVRAWLHQGGKLEPLPLSSSSSSVHADPSLMMVHYGNQYYLQPLHWKGEGKREKAWLQLERKAESHDVGGPPLDDDTLARSPQDDLHTLATMFPRHYSLAPDKVTILAESSEGKSESALMLYYDQDTFSEMCTNGPYGLAVYFYADLLPNSDYNVSGDGQPECSLPPDAIPHEEVGWQWLITKLLSAVKYLLFAAFVLTCNKLRRHVRSQRHRNSSSSSSADLVDDEEFPFFGKLVGTLRRHSSQTESGSTLVARTPSVPNSSTETLVSLTRANSVPEPRVLPRFGSDYELKGRLGKGGFGVVYHVQNKTDGGEYAVKRIKLPPNKAAREKVMREVRALAQLDHPRIVRYFNSWVEKAPMGWNQMEEWMPLSRRGSYIQEVGEPVSSSILPSSSVGRSSPSPSFSLHPPHAHMVGQSSSISPCPSFNSLSHSNIHSIIPPPSFTADSRSSSFVIEFRDESDQPVPASEDHVTSDHRNSQLLNGHGASDCKPANGHTVESKNGCFSRALLRDRDDLSSAGDSESTQHRDEGRDSVADLGVEPPTYLFIQMQLCRKESLKDWLKSNISSRCHGKVMHFFDQILDAVRYVHSKGMMHRDLKPSNIFFSLDGTIKVGDFGLVTSSAYGGLRSSYVALKGLAEEQPTHRQHTGNLGTHFYMSPEQMSGHKYDHKVDIYSLGVILFELHYPFHTDMERAKVLENVRKHKFPLNFEAKLPRQAELVKWLMADLASNRPIVEDIYASSTFKQLQDTVMETIPLL